MPCRRCRHEVPGSGGRARPAVVDGRPSSRDTRSRAGPDRRSAQMGRHPHRRTSGLPRRRESVPRVAGPTVAAADDEFCPAASRAHLGKPSGTPVAGARSAPDSDPSRLRCGQGALPALGAAPRGSRERPAGPNCRGGSARRTFRQRNRHLVPPHARTARPPARLPASERRPEADERRSGTTPRRLRASSSRLDSTRPRIPGCMRAPRLQPRRRAGRSSALRAAFRVGCVAWTL